MSLRMVAQVWVRRRADGVRWGRVAGTFSESRVRRKMRWRSSGGRVRRVAVVMMDMMGGYWGR
jgi:hypothetical protein